MTARRILALPDPTNPVPQLVAAPGEDGWAHAWTTTPDGIFQPVADVHLVCGGTSCFTQTQPDGSLRHVCRDCVVKAASGGKE